MTREDAKQLLPIIQAFAEGKCVETKTGSGWVNMENMSFSGKPKAYRIKPEPKYRPFANAEECWNEMQKHRPFGWVKRFGNYTQIITLDNNTITLSNSIGKSSFLSYKDYKQITFADGSVFGVKVED